MGQSGIAELRDQAADADKLTNSIFAISHQVGVQTWNLKELSEQNAALKLELAAARAENERLASRLGAAGDGDSMRDLLKRLPYSDPGDAKAWLANHLGAFTAASSCEHRQIRWPLFATRDTISLAIDLLGAAAEVKEAMRRDGQVDPVAEARVARTRASVGQGR